MLEIILIMVAWRRGWGVKALLPTAFACLIIFLFGYLGNASTSNSSIILLSAVVVEYLALGIMIFIRP